MPSSTNNASVILICAILSILSTQSKSTSPFSSPCTNRFLRITKQNFTNCKRLTALDAEFAWNLHNRNNSQIQILFGAPLDEQPGWIAWGVNPGDQAQMVGTRALIGVIHPNSSVTIGKYNITADTKKGCQLRESEIEVGVSDLRMEHAQGMFMISATVMLPAWAYDVSRLNHVWQVGYDVVEGTWPGMHPTVLQNVDSTETIDLTTGWSHSAGHHRQHLRVVHGVLNIVGWGTVLPAGVMIARYLKDFPFRYKLWHKLHIGCQIVGYTVGTIGWALGLWLGRASELYSFPIHRLLALVIFAFTTLQMLALWYYRRGKVWKMYHHLLGYSLIVVISINIFHGADILKPDRTWKWAYTGVLVALASITLGLEIFTWARFILCRYQSKQSQNQERKQQQQLQSENPNPPPPVGDPASQQGRRPKIGASGPNSSPKENVSGGNLASQQGQGPKIETSGPNSILKENVGGGGGDPASQQGRGPKIGPAGPN